MSISVGIIIHQKLTATYYTNTSCFSLELGYLIFKVNHNLNDDEWMETAMHIMWKAIYI